jgi:Fur family peroxide stress response transcriptional regulator
MMMMTAEARHGRLERFRTAAREAGIRLTPQRLAIFEAVANNAAHPSAESVYRSVRESMPTVSLDTIYRTLWMHRPGAAHRHGIVA